MSVCQTQWRLTCLSVRQVETDMSVCLSDRMETEAEAVQEDAERWTSAMLTLLQQPPAPADVAAPAEAERGAVGREERAGRRSAGVTQPALSREEAHKLLDRAALSSMDGCLHVLAALNVRQALQESE